MLTTLAAIVLVHPLTVSFECRATRLPNILKQLQKQTGGVVECEASFNDDVLVIRAERVPVDQLLDRIAVACVGTWRKETNKITLTPDIKRRQQQEAEHLIKREKAVQRSLDQLSKEVDGEYVPPNQRDRPSPVNGAISALDTGKFERRGPLQRLGLRTLIALGAKRLAQIKPGERLVLSSAPNRLQLPWPNLSRSLPLFLKEWNVMYSQGTSGTYGSGYMTLRNGASFPDYLDSVDRIWMGVTGSPQTSDLGTATIGFTRAGGNVEIGTTISIQSSGAPTEPPPPSSTNKVDLPLYPESQAMGKALGTTFSFPRLAQAIPQEVIDNLQTPLERDPLSFGSEVYLGYAKAKDVNLVAWINDNAFTRFLVGGQKSVTTQEFELRSRPFMEFTESGEWLLMTPSSPVAARKGRDRRESLQKLVASIKLNKRLTLDARANYVLLRGFGITDGIGKWMALILDQNASPNAFNLNEDAMRLYALCSSTQRASLAGGNALPFSALTQEQCALLNRAVFGARPYNSSSAVTQGPAENRQRYVYEPTEVLPQGIHSFASFSLVKTLDLALEASMKAGNHLWSGYGAQSLASMLFYEKHPELIEGDISTWVKPDQFNVSEVNQFVLSLHMQDGLSWRAALTDATVLASKVSRDQLPKAMQDKVDAELRKLYELKAQGAQMKMTLGSPGAKAIPPPRS